jgi:hypothetical protein
VTRAGPQESEAVKKNLVKLGDAYAILGNLRLSTGNKIKANPDPIDFSRLDSDPDLDPGGQKK